MTQTELNEIIRLHGLWYRDDPAGKRANLTGADLRDANLRRANLRGADLTSANLRGADLRGADLRRANLTSANLGGADLTSANLTGADLADAYLEGANLRGANLPHYSIVPESGGFTAYKKCSGGAIVTLYIPARARRTSSLVGRKCRAEYAKVISIISREGRPFHAVQGTHDKTTYTVGEIVRPDSYDDDIRVECTHGIHFFITRREAEEYNA